MVTMHQHACAHEQRVPPHFHSVQLFHLSRPRIILVDNPKNRCLVKHVRETTAHPDVGTEIGAVHTEKKPSARLRNMK